MTLHICMQNAKFVNLHTYLIIQIMDVIFYKVSLEKLNQTYIINQNRQTGPARRD